MTVDEMFVNPTSIAPHVRDGGISTMCDPGVHHPTAIVNCEIVGQYLGYRAPVVGRSARREMRVSWLPCFQPRRLRLQFVKAGERGVEVCLVEYFAAG